MPAYPLKPLDSLTDVRELVSKCTTWYNNSHLCRGLKFVTPVQRHNGEDLAILEKREIVYEKSRKYRPERWSGKTRNWNQGQMVKLTPGNEQALNFEF